MGLYLYKYHKPYRLRKKKKKKSKSTTFPLKKTQKTPQKHKRRPHETKYKHRPHKNDDTSITQTTQKHTDPNVTHSEVDIVHPVRTAVPFWGRNQSNSK